VALKSIAAYRSGLEINPNVSKMDAEDGLRMELSGILFFFVRDRTPKETKQISNNFYNYMPP
jgi:hypothetical protein